jgi:RNA polymerase sigma-70 factor, ECF subfamily
MDDTTSPDAEIISRVTRGGDVQAYGTLVERYERGLLAAVLPVVRDVHAAQDVVQDAFVQAYTGLTRLRDPSRFRPWLLKIAQRDAVRAAKRGRRTHMSLANVEPEGAAAADSGALLDDERRRLLDGVKRLPDHERAAVSLRYFDGHGVHDIARITGRPVGTVTKQLSRALQRLRDDLTPENSSWNPQNSRSATA